MDLISSLSLLVLILVAFSLVAGGRPSAVLRPALRFVHGMLNLVTRTLIAVLGSVFRVGAASIKLPKAKPHQLDRPSGPPPPRWKE